MCGKIKHRTEVIKINIIISFLSFSLNHIYLIVKRIFELKHGGFFNARTYVHALRIKYCNISEHKISLEESLFRKKKIL